MNVFNKLVTPNWLLDSGIIQCFRNIKQAFSELEVCESVRHRFSADAYTQSYMLEMIQIRRGAEKRVERYDLFSSLLDANEEPGEGQIALTDRELIGNYTTTVSSHIPLTFAPHWQATCSFSFLLVSYPYAHSPEQSADPTFFQDMKWVLSDRRLREPVLITNTDNSTLALLCVRDARIVPSRTGNTLPASTKCLSRRQASGIRGFQLS